MAVTFFITQVLALLVTGILFTVKINDVKSVASGATTERSITWHAAAIALLTFLYSKAIENVVAICAFSSKKKSGALIAKAICHVIAYIALAAFIHALAERIDMDTSAAESWDIFIGLAWLIVTSLVSYYISDFVSLMCSKSNGYTRTGADDDSDDF